MKFLNDGVEKVMVDFEVDMDNRERTILFEYARDNMSEDEFENMMVNWAMIDILQKEIDRKTSETPDTLEGDNK